MFLLLFVQTIASSSLSHRKAAYDEIRRACKSVDAKLHYIQFQKLDFEEISVIDTFYNADVAIVDVSIQDQQNSLFYRLGNRESFGMKQNILLFNDYTADVTIPIRFPSANYTIFTYRLSDDKRCYITEPAVTRLVSGTDDDAIGSQLSAETKMTLCMKLKKVLQEVEIQTK